ncbi:acyl-CoA dehydrogenase family protein [Myxococcota bacterium]|nr:acyl-CoA dehydrogenase family protein [Myxococcota bacterium]
MNLEYSEEYVAFRAEVREFLQGWPLTGDEAQLPVHEQEIRFRRRGIERGYVYRNFPRAYGGSEQTPDVLRERIIREEYAEASAPGDSAGQGPSMLAPTLLELGTEAQRERFIAPTLAGEISWCQGYSEPGAGSDLASLQTRAELQGDEWVINGHKIWTTTAHEADFMFGLFRTEPQAPKHAGISYLLVDMKAPGIEIRPLREMTGASMFNEVFFDNVRTPAENIVGKRGEGWQVSRATLKHERNLIGDPNFMRRAYLSLLQLARDTTRNGRPAIEDPSIRQELAQIEGFFMSLEYTGARLLTATARNEEAKVILPMMTMKLYGTDLRQRITRLALDLLENRSLIAPTEEEGSHGAPEGRPGTWTADYMSAIAISIAGGASNIQRNIIGERALGLPRDLRTPK